MLEPKNQSARGPAGYAGLFAGLVALPLALGNLFLVRESMEDDAYISFRYLENWLSGNGLAFNVGERVEGYTNFLWIALLAVPRSFGISVEVSAVALSTVLLCILFWSAFRAAAILSGEKGAGLLACVLLAGSTSLMRWVGSGMETLLFATLLCAACFRLALSNKPDLTVASLFGLAILTRPDGVLFAFAALLAFLLGGPGSASNRFRVLAGPSLFLALFPLLHTAFRVTYYGSWLPNTFYAKVAGSTPAGLDAGLGYFTDFLGSGGLFLVLPALLTLHLIRWTDWRIAGLGAQIVLLSAYVTYIGGDYLPFSRFLIPAVPLLAILGAIGLSALARRRENAWPLVFLAATVLATAQLLSAVNSIALQAHGEIAKANKERILVAGLLKDSYPSDTTLAVNAAGIIPFFTAMPTVDMLGLNDRHIARAEPSAMHGGYGFVGHFKQDGDYVCRRRPDVIVTGGGRLHRGRSEQEAIAQAALNSFASDRALLQQCGERYAPVAKRLLPGAYAVVYAIRVQRDTLSAPADNADALAWFNWGLHQLSKARVEEARQAFERALLLAPDNPVIMGNIAYTYLDAGNLSEARSRFQEILRQWPNSYDALYGLALAEERLGNKGAAIALWRRYVERAPESPWKDRARSHLRLLGQ